LGLQTHTCRSRAKSEGQIRLEYATCWPLIPRISRDSSRIFIDVVPPVMPDRARHFVCPLVRRLGCTLRSHVSTCSRWIHTGLLGRLLIMTENLRVDGGLCGEERHGRGRPESGSGPVGARTHPVRATPSRQLRWLEDREDGWTCRGLVPRMPPARFRKGPHGADESARTDGGNGIVDRVPRSMSPRARSWRRQSSVLG
jgi:hypothetical protein